MCNGMTFCSPPPHFFCTLVHPRLGWVMMGVVTGKRWAVGSRTCNQPQVLEEELCVQSSVTKFPHLATGLRQRQILTEHLQTALPLYCLCTLYAPQRRWPACTLCNKLSYALSCSRWPEWTSPDPSWVEKILPISGYSGGIPPPLVRLNRGDAAWICAQILSQDPPLIQARTCSTPILWLAGLYLKSACRCFTKVVQLLRQSPVSTKIGLSF